MLSKHTPDFGVEEMCAEDNALSTDISSALALSLSAVSFIFESSEKIAAKARLLQDSGRILKIKSNEDSLLL